MWQRFLCIFLSACLGSVVAAQSDTASNAPGARFFDYGPFCAIETVDHQVAEDTISGVLNLVETTPTLYSHGPLVPAQIGIGFGVLIDVAPDFAGPATVVTTHPPMGPNGVTRQTWTTDYVTGDTSYNGFTFEYDYELVKGPWSISASNNGRLIYEAYFTVVDPMTLPPPPCGTAPLS